ncbi:MAG: metallophosphoesterase [Deltaproteobacteria bacterium]|jgi:3',5'-cyclic AMP phosphodiesterase CpdA|nr:metallophosphoesterase [Deltaproteobacteria bacterium]
MLLILIILLLNTPVQMGQKPSLPGDLPDPSFLYQPYAKQKAQVVSRLENLLSPTLGHPAVVTSGKRFAIWTAKKPTQITLIPANECLDDYIIKKFSSKAYKLKPQQVLYRTVAFTPQNLPRGTYHLKITLFSKTNKNIETREPNAVRNLGHFNPHEQSFSILLFSDHQLRDPSWKLQNGLKAPASFPHHDQDKENLSIAYQGLAEIRLLNPDFTVHLGDLLFGLDFAEEYQEAFDLFSRSGFSTFMIPGNHDGYAKYNINLPSFSKISFGFLKCRKLFPKNKNDWIKIWNFLTCMYSDLKNIIFNNLDSDGLVFWKKILGPLEYSQSIGKFHLIFINSYGGTPERRHSFSIYIKLFDYHLGAPAVDNYGGYLSEKSLKWIENELKFASNNKLTPLIFSHHDPRGNLDKTPYHKNEPFPTSPIGIGHFEEWNFDDDWDSNPKDNRKIETTTDNSAIKLLKLLAEYGGYFFSGHIHKDHQNIYKQGDKIRDIKLEKDLSFVKITTAASSRKDNGYWGYRLIRANPDGSIDLKPFAKKNYSIATGNLWLEQSKEDENKFSLYHSLPAGVELTLNRCLPYSENGYKIEGPAKTGLEFIRTQVIERFKAKNYRFILKTGSDNTPYKTPEVEKFSIKKASNNHPPQIIFTVNGEKLQPGQKVITPVTIDARPSKDPDKDSLFSPLWEVENNQIRKYFVKVDANLPSTGEEIHFSICDRFGACSRKSLKVYPPAKIAKKTSALGCGCQCLFITGTSSTAVILLLLIILFYTRKRISSSKKQKTS